MNFQKIEIKFNEDDEYEAYLDNNLIYKSEDLFVLLESVVFKLTPKEGNIVEVVKNYIDNYKELLNLCRKIAFQ